MIPMKYWIKKVISVEDFTDTYKQMKGKEPKQPVLKIVMETSCFGNITTETRYFYIDEWMNIKRIGCFVG